MADEAPLDAGPPQPVAERRNSPLAILAVLALVGMILAVVALPGQVTKQVVGTALPGPPPDTKPNAAAPQVALEGNALLTPGMKLPVVTCKVPAFGRSADQLKAYYQGLIGCLDEAWRPLLSQANQPWESPALSVEDNPVSSCGTPTTQEAVAFYCPRDKKIFMPRDRVIESMGSNQGGHIMVMAHEYAHHVQALSGINHGLGLKLTGVADDSPQALELTRRMELQADCFSGMFIAAASGRGSISKSVGNSASNAFRSSVADKTHGSVKHQIQWGTAGFKNNNTASCNTWAAPPAEVS